MGNEDFLLYCSYVPEYYNIRTIPQIEKKPKEQYLYANPRIETTVKREFIKMLIIFIKY